MKKLELEINEKKKHDKIVEENKAVQEENN